MIDNIFLDDTQAVRMYVGDEIVWEKQSGDLPSGYTEVEYIYPSEIAIGAGYFDTGIILDNNCEVLVDFEVICFKNEVQVITPKNAFIFGCREGASSKNFAALISQISFNTQWDFGDYKVNRYLSTSVQIGERHTMIINKNAYNLDGVDVAKMNHITFNTDPLTCYIYNVRDLTMGMFNANMKLYNFQIRKDGEVLFNAIPCYRNSDGTVGLFDIVSNRFLTSNINYLYG